MDSRGAGVELSRIGLLAAAFPQTNAALTPQVQDLHVDAPELRMHSMHDCTTIVWFANNIVWT
jgi:hypothetical protein